jgi:transposase
VLEALGEQSFAAVKRTFGVSYGRAQRILLRLKVPWCEWWELVGKEGPLCLGIDEHSYRGKDLLITLTSLWPRRMLQILEDDRQETLKRALQALPEEVKQRIVGVCIDGRRAFRNVVREVLPQATVVMDHFHLIQDANKRLDETRRLEQNGCRRTLPRWPLLKGQERLTRKQIDQLRDLVQRFATIRTQYWVKEKLRELYGCPSLETAQEHFEAIVLNCDNAEDVETVLWGRFLRQWQKEILGYFHLKITNAYTEGCHTKVKLIKRLSYGFRNVQVYIRKVMLGFLPHSFEAFAPHLLT